MYRRLEDLQFQLEEQGVISGDQLETATEDSSKRLLELERADQEAGERTRALQGELLEKERQLTTQLSTITELVGFHSHVRLAMLRGLCVPTESRAELLGQQQERHTGASRWLASVSRGDDTSLIPL